MMMSGLSIVRGDDADDLAHEEHGLGGKELHKLEPGTSAAAIQAGQDPGNGESVRRVHAADPGVQLAALHRQQRHLTLVVRHVRHEDGQLSPGSQQSGSGSAAGAGDTPVHNSIVVSIIIINIIISTCSDASLLGSNLRLSSFMLILLAFFMMLSWSCMATDNSITADLSELWTLPRPGAGCLSVSESQHTTTTDSTCTCAAAICHGLKIQLRENVANFYQALMHDSEHEGQLVLAEPPHSGLDLADPLGHGGGQLQ